MTKTMTSSGLHQPLFSAAARKSAAFIAMALLVTGLTASLPLVPTISYQWGQAQARSDSPLEALRQHRKHQRSQQRISEARKKLGFLRGVYPIISTQSLDNLELALQKYRYIVQQGGWPLVHTRIPLRNGARDPGVVQLRQRLLISGDLPRFDDQGRPQEYEALSNVYDDDLQIAVARFQSRHGLIPDGIIGQSTLKHLNTPAAVRLQQLELNQGRIDAMLAGMPGRYVLVNLPAAEIEAVDGGYVESRHTAVVGKIDRQTPILNSRIYELNFHPYWTVPKSIIRKDLIPLMRRDPDYLKRNDIHIYSDKGEEIPPFAIDWSTNEAVKYTFRQNPGAVNSLGSVRINFSNMHQVYLHDTPERGLFRTDYRFHSSGCVRVGDISRFISWLLKYNTEWPEHRVAATLESGVKQNLPLDEPVPLSLGYITAWATNGGDAHFRDDIYRLDGVGSVYFFTNSSN